MIKAWLGAIILTAVPVMFIVAIFLGYNEENAEEVAEEIEEVREYENAPKEAEAAEKEAEEWIDLSLPTEEDKKVAVNTAKTFVSIFHTVDPENPYDYVLETEPFVTAEFFEKYKGIPKRGTLEAAELVVKSMEALPVELNAEEQVWTIVVTSMQKPEIGETELVYDEYSVLLVKEAQAWKVDGVKLNER